MNPQEIETAILNAMKKANPGAEKAQKLTDLRSEAKARAQMAEAEISTMEKMGMSRAEAWSEVASLFLKP